MIGDFREELSRLAGLIEPTACISADCVNGPTKWECGLNQMYITDHRHADRACKEREFVGTGVAHTTMTAV